MRIYFYTLRPLTGPVYFGGVFFWLVVFYSQRLPLSQFALAVGLLVIVRAIFLMFWAVAASRHIEERAVVWHQQMIGWNQTLKARAGHHLMESFEHRYFAIWQGEEIAVV